jgi:hypothetical protein
VQRTNPRLSGFLFCQKGQPSDLATVRYRKILQISADRPVFGLCFLITHAKKSFFQAAFLYMRARESHWGILRGVAKTDLCAFG